MSLLDEARDAPIVADVVVLRPEARDALVELADKALVVEEWLRGAGYEGTADELLPALERLQR